MGKYTMVVQSQPKAGRDEEYNAWYDTTHFREICELPGVKGGRRLRSTPVALGGPGLPYLAIFEIEADDPAQIMKEMGVRSQDGTWQRCDALDAAATVLWIYEAYEGEG